MAFRLEDHLKRLNKSAELLEMELAYTTEEIIAAIKATVVEGMEWWEDTLAAQFPNSPNSCRQNGTKSW